MTNVKTVSWQGQSVDLVSSAAISSGEQEEIERRMKALDQVLASETKPATYKLEVMFNDQRSGQNPFGGVITWWENGNKLHGGGDSKLYLCPGKDRSNNGCESLLPDGARGLKFIACGACGSLWTREDVYGEIFYKLTVSKWADVLLSWFVKLGLDADIRIKFARDDIRAVARLEQEQQMGGELLAAARSTERRSAAIYPMANIVKDTAAGADLHGRILAFLKS